MPPADYIQQSLTGAWHLMMGRREGMRLLDLSADGFWTSFFAIVLALPVLVVTWVTLANDIALQGSDLAPRLGIVLRLAVIDMAAWVLPLVALALLAKPAGIADRFIHYVVAANWGNAIFIWIMLPPSLIRLFLPGASEMLTAFSLGLFLFTMVLSWRLTNAAIDKGAAVATSVFAGLFVTSLFVLFTLQGLLGVTPPQ